MSTAKTHSYLNEISDILRAQWPENRCVNIVCHGHSVPAGYFATPTVNTFSAYPHLLHKALKNRFPYAVINVIVTAIGGEHSEAGAARFVDEVLCHRPDLLLIDYALNDRCIGLEKSKESWTNMIKAGLDYGTKIILLTPTADMTQDSTYKGDDKSALDAHAIQVRQLATEFGVALVDSLAVFKDYAEKENLNDILSWSNHPNRAGHELVAKELLRFFPAG